MSHSMCFICYNKPNIKFDLQLSLGYKKYNYNVGCVYGVM